MTPDSELLRGNVPTLVLSALASGPQHGYAIAQGINKRTNNSLKLKQGTLYPVLHTLERNGLVSGDWQHEAGERPRLVYAITEAGRAELDRRVEAWKTFARAMNTIIGTHAGEASHEQPA
jgi:PadR family transcriptional regulator PadR